MKTVLLTDEEISFIHKNYLVKDFPKNEVRPLRMMLRNRKKGIYECIGLYDGDLLKAYAFFIRCGNDYLLDYLSVLPGMRDQGIGSEFIPLIAEHLKNADSLIAEVEDPDCADTDEEKAIQQKRLSFYQRNGFLLTEARAKTFGVDFLLIELPVNGAHTKKETELLYPKFYKETLPFFVYCKKVVKIK